MKKQYLLFKNRKLSRKKYPLVVIHASHYTSHIFMILNELWGRENDELWDLQKANVKLIFLPPLILFFTSALWQFYKFFSISTL